MNATHRDLAPIATGRQQHSSGRKRQLKGDLDNIILKALRKEPTRRYSTVEQLAEDIRRHLQGLPVSATPDSLPYRAKKFIQRHTLGVAAIAMIIAAIAGGVFATVRQARIAEANRRRAEARFNDVRKLANSLIFEVHDSIAELSGATAARKLILQRALEYLDSLSKEAGNEPDLMRELATAYERVGALQGDPLDPNLGDVKGAAISLNKAISLREALAKANPDNSKDHLELAVVYLDASDFQSGVARNLALGFDYNKKAIAILDPLAASDPKNFRVIAQDTRAHTNLGFLQVGNGAGGSVGSVKQAVVDLQRAGELDQQAIQINPKSIPLRAQESVIALLLGDASSKLGDRAAALNYYRKAIEIMSSVDPGAHNASIALNSLVTQGKIADVLEAEGKFDEAVALFRKSQQGAFRLAATDPNSDSPQELIITSSGQLGHALIEAGKIDEGLKQLQVAIDRLNQKASLTPLQDIYEAIAHAWIGEALERKGQVAASATEYQKSKDYAAAARSGVANDARTQVYYCASTDKLGAALLKLGKLSAAQKEYDECRDLLESLLKANPENVEVLYALAETYTGEGDISVAIARQTKGDSTTTSAWNQASEWYQKSLNTWSTVPNPVRISTSTMEVRIPADVSRKLSDCKAQQSVSANRL